MMNPSASWPVIQGKGGALKNTNVSMGSPKAAGGSRTILCCTKIKFLSGMLWLSYMVHVLVVSLALSMLYYRSTDVLDVSGEVDSSEMGTELLIVGVTGTLANIVALIGIWKGQRLFLVPVMVYMAVTILLDFVTSVRFFVGQLEGDDDFAVYDDLETIDVDSVGMTRLISPTKHTRERSFAALFPLFLIKMVISIILFRTLCDVYKRDLTMRATRSPIRNMGKCVLEWPMEGKCSPPPQGCQNTEKESSSAAVPTLKYSRIM